ncbi:MAG: tetratricopeptide repeat protein [Bacteroidales bacterium]|nr:tetratricopeptide repeat protein [Bacteroidales bacterium]
MNKFLQVILLVIGLGVLAGCSVKKNTVVTRNFHNMTSHYNIYFNALESYKAGIKKAESSYSDDFNTLIPLYIYSTREAARMMLPGMDKTYKKCSKLITLHSIKAKPKLKKRGRLTEKDKAFLHKNEYNKWIDDAFLLMGKAYFMKHDFFPAIENLQYVIRQFPEDGLKDQTGLWLAKTYIELKKYRDAGDVLNRLQGEPDLDPALVPELLATYADLHYRQKEWAEAVDFLSRAAESYPDRKQKTRMYFVLAQLYEQLDEKVLASEAFAKVVDLNPPYEMAFSAKINRARLYEGDPESGAQIRKELNKMLKDDKNLDYLDQIYYALGELDLKEGKTEEALKNYRLSVLNFYNNNTQHAISYLALGKYYYKIPDYIQAAAYYDSCTQFLPESYPAYKEVTALSDNLQLLSENLQIIRREDSLQTVARMPEAERDTLIAKKIAEAKKLEEARKKAEEEALANKSAPGMRAGRMGGRNMMNRGMGGQPGGRFGQPGRGMGSQPGGRGGAGMTGGMPGMDGASGWYFYNPATLSYGQSEFVKTWGRRKLEDNWRRSNKKISTSSDDLSAEGESGQVETPVSDSKASQFEPTTRDYYIADLPLTDSMMKKSHERIAAALFNVGKLFKDNFHKPMEAVPNFVKLDDRYPDNEKILFSYYNLYEIYSKDLVQPDEAEKYKKLILKKFPDSRTAKIISNPNYFAELEKIRSEVIRFYDSTYRAYQSGAYEEVIDNCKKADTAFGLNPIRDKFGLLNALAFTRLHPRDTTGIKEILNEVIFKFPDSDVAEPAKNLLSYIQQGPQSEALKPGSKLSVGTVKNR